MTPRIRRDEFVIAPHHPDRVRRPPVAAVSAAADRFQQALTWNTFRTLELVSPSFWLRRIQARLTHEALLVAPQIARVHLWRGLPLAPGQQLDGRQPEVVVDVLVETEHRVWALIVAPPGNEGPEFDRAAAVVDAVTWWARVRQLQYGVIEADSRTTSPGRVLQTRYSRSTHSASLRSAATGTAAPARVGWGLIGWTDLAAVLRDCAEGVSVPRIERAVASNALDWLRSVGIEG